MVYVPLLSIQSSAAFLPFTYKMKLMLCLEKENVKCLLFDSMTQHDFNAWRCKLCFCQ